MSIHWMNTVWKESQASGSELLLLLAIADNANDDGVAWPGQKYLAHKIRMSYRSVRRLADKLVEMGELAVAVDIGRTNTNTYYILTGRSDRMKGEIRRVAAEKSKKEDILSSFPAEKGDNLSSFSEKKEDTQGKKEDTQGEKRTKIAEKEDTAMSYKPSLTPSIKPSEPLISPDPNLQQQQVLLTATLQSMGFDPKMGAFIKRFLIRPEVLQVDGCAWTVLVDQPPPEVMDAGRDVVPYLQDRLGVQLERQLAAMVCEGNIDVIFERRGNGNGKVRDLLDTLPAAAGSIAG